MLLIANGMYIQGINAASQYTNNTTSTSTTKEKSTIGTVEPNESNRRGIKRYTTLNLQPIGEHFTENQVWSLLVVNPLKFN